MTKSLDRHGPPSTSVVEEIAEPVDEPALLTVDQFAAQVGVGHTTAYKLVMSGEVQSVRIGRLRRIPVPEVQAFIERMLAAQD